MIKNPPVFSCGLLKNMSIFVKEGFCNLFATSEYLTPSELKSFFCICIDLISIVLPALVLIGEPHYFGSELLQFNLPLNLDKAFMCKFQHFNLSAGSF